MLRNEAGQLLSGGSHPRAWCQNVQRVFEKKKKSQKRRQKEKEDEEEEEEEKEEEREEGKEEEKEEREEEVPWQELHNPMHAPRGFVCSESNEIVVGRERYRRDFLILRSGCP